MLVLGLLGWMIGGYLVVCISLMIHMFNAERKGYEAMKYLEENLYPVAIEILHSKSGIAALVLGLLIWPVRWIQFLIDIPNYYEAYELKH